MSSENKIANNRSKQSDIKCPRKALVSYLWVTMFASLACKYATDNLKIIIDAQGFFPLETFAIPLVFLVTVVRFSVGNILHLRSLEETTSPSFIWVMDFIMVFVESVFFLLLGAFSYGNNFRFFLLLMFLMFVDVIWILSMNIHRTKRPQIPYSWALLNGISALALVGIAIAQLYYNISYFENMAIVIALTIWFLLCAVVDLCVDHYELWRPRKNKSPSS